VVNKLHGYKKKNRDKQEGKKFFHWLKEIKNVKEMNS
jgi:hypothetical protein